MSDYINRHEAIDALNKRARDTFTLADGYQWYLSALHDVADDIRQLPSVHSKLEKNSKELENKNGELISRQKAIEVASRECHELRGVFSAIEHGLKKLPSAQPERNNGHWVEIGDEPYDEWECDNCGFVIDGSGCIDPYEYRDIYKFCPNCGSYNGGG